MSDPRQCIRGLRSNDAEQRRQAIEQLSRMGDDAVFAEVALVQACADENEEVRVAAGDVLENLGPPDPDHCVGLAQLIASPDSDVVFWAATLLGRAGRDAADYVGALEELLEEGSRPAPVLKRVAWALSQIGSERAMECLKRAAMAPHGARHAAVQGAI